MAQIKKEVKDVDPVTYREAVIIGNTRSVEHKNKISGHEWTTRVNAKGYKIHADGFDSRVFGTIKAAKEHIDFVRDFHLEIVPQKFFNPEILVTVMLPEDKAAALRFHETCEDSQDYDVSKDMMKRLAHFGLVQHLGGGVYRGTGKLDRLCEILQQPEVTYSKQISVDALNKAFKNLSANYDFDKVMKVVRKLEFRATEEETEFLPAKKGAAELTQLMICSAIQNPKAFNETFKHVGIVDAHKTLSGMESLDSFVDLITRDGEFVIEPDSDRLHIMHKSQLADKTLRLATVQAVLSRLRGCANAVNLDLQLAQVQAVAPTQS